VFALGSRYFFLPLFLSGACVSAEAATAFTALGVFELCRSRPAVLATFFDVRSFFAILRPFHNRIGCYVDSLLPVFLPVTVIFFGHRPFLGD